MTKDLPSWTLVFVWSYLALAAIDWFLFLKRPAWYDAAEFIIEPLQLVCAFVIAAACLAYGDIVGCAIWLGLVLTSGWTWWHRHDKRRKKLLKKTAERVVDAGGRLKIVRGPEGSTT